MYDVDQDRPNKRQDNALFWELVDSQKPNPVYLGLPGSFTVLSKKFKLNKAKKIYAVEEDTRSCQAMKVQTRKFQFKDRVQVVKGDIYSVSIEDDFEVPEATVIEDDAFGIWSPQNYKKSLDLVLKNAGSHCAVTITKSKRSVKKELANEAREFLTDTFSLNFNDVLHWQGEYGTDNECLDAQGNLRHNPLNMVTDYYLLSEEENLERHWNEILIKKAEENGARRLR